MNGDEMLKYIKDKVDKIDSEVGELSIGQAEVKVKVENTEKQLTNCKAKSHSDHSNLFSRMRDVEDGKISKRDLWIMLAIFGTIFGVIVKVL